MGAFMQENCFLLSLGLRTLWFQNGKSSVMRGNWVSWSTFDSSPLTEIFPPCYWQRLLFCHSRNFQGIMLQIEFFPCTHWVSHPWADVTAATLLSNRIMVEIVKVRWLQDDEMNANRNEKISEVVVCFLFVSSTSVFFDLLTLENYSAVNNGGCSKVFISIQSLFLRLFTGLAWVVC